jgi:hypothetical protein
VFHPLPEILRIPHKPWLFDFIETLAWSTVAALEMLLCPCMSFAGCNRLKHHETLKVHKSWHFLPQEKGHSDLVGEFQILIVVQSTVQKKNNYCYLVGGSDHFLFSIIYGIILPIE